MLAPSILWFCCTRGVAFLCGRRFSRCMHRLTSAVSFHSGSKLGWAPNSPKISVHLVLIRQPASRGGECPCAEGLPYTCRTEDQQLHDRWRGRPPGKFMNVRSALNPPYVCTSLTSSAEFRTILSCQNGPFRIPTRACAGAEWPGPPAPLPIGKPLAIQFGALAQSKAGTAEGHHSRCQASHRSFQIQARRVGALPRRRPLNNPQRYQCSHQL